jgi:N-dimethylarginine dimethylaminohydrolase
VRQHLLMCSPEGFAVNYEINPWMKGQVGCIDRQVAIDQWQGLHRQLSALAEIEVMAGDAAWPDLVFTANAGLPLPAEKTFVLASFRYRERQGETAISRRWFEARGWRCLELGASIRFEGAGDALADSEGRLFVADGSRTDRAAAEHLAAHFKGPVHSLRLVDPRYYHLDTCFCPLTRGYALYLTEAFDTASQDLLHQSFGDRLIALTAEEGCLFCANAVNIDDVIVMNAPTPRLTAVLGVAGFRLMGTPLTEFIKSGGSAKCLTLRLDQA